MSNEYSTLFFYTYEYFDASEDMDVDEVSVEVVYCQAAAATTAKTEAVASTNLVIPLLASSAKTVYPNSISFIMADHMYWDAEGIIYRDGDYVIADGVESGTVDYTTGVVTLFDWIVGSPAINLTSMLVVNKPYIACRFTAYTAIAPLQPQSLSIAVTAVNGALLAAQSDATGAIVGDYIRGFVDVDSGIIDLEFGELVVAANLSDSEKAQDWYNSENVGDDGKIWYPISVFPETARYNCVAYVYMPLSADVLGIDPVRLPLDGRVPIFRVGDIIVIHNTIDTAVPTISDGLEIDCGRERLAWAHVYNADGTLVNTSDYSVDLDAGVVTLTTVANMTAPLKITHRIEDMALVNDLQINGTLGITRQLSHTFPASTSYVSSALLTTDLFARVTDIFEQASWTGVWSDEVIGNIPLSAFNSTAFPIVVSNIGTTQERWMCKFVSSTSFDVYGEFSGKINSTPISTSTSFAPLNPATGQPYFTIPSGGWGTGWSTGNILRFNTIAANRPIWVARTVLQSDAYSGTDRFCLEVRGDVDTP